MKLIGSRLLGICDESSDFDYVALDGTGSTYADIWNEHLGDGKHCYHYPREYRENLGRYIVPTDDDIQWIYNPEDYVAGIIDTNPFDYEDKWREMLRGIDPKHHLFWSSRGIPKKKFYHLVYNILCLENGSFELTEEQRVYLKSFHDLTAVPEDYVDIADKLSKL